MKAPNKALYSRSVDDQNHRLDVSLRDAPPGVRLKIEAALNEVGVLFRLCAVLYSFNWSIQEARIASPESNRISDDFWIIPGAGAGASSELQFRSMIDDLEKLLFGGVSVLEYLTQRKAAIPRTEFQAAHGEVTLSAKRGGETVIEITGRDKRGLLLILTQAFYLMDIDILEADIHTDPDGRVRNRFVVDPRDERFYSTEFQNRLCEELRVLV